jgi:hypothetical protein
LINTKDYNGNQEVIMVPLFEILGCSISDVCKDYSIVMIQYEQDSAAGNTGNA